MGSRVERKLTLLRRRLTRLEDSPKPYATALALALNGIHRKLELSIKGILDRRK